MAETVIRYAPTYVNARGDRVLMLSMQGRDTFVTASDAAVHFDNIIKNNSPDRIRELWGENPQFEIRPVRCYVGHFDPVALYFDTPTVDDMVMVNECDGPGPHSTKKEVRLLPTGGGGHVIVCHQCYVKEMAYRRSHNQRLSTSLQYPLPPWESLMVFKRALEEVTQ